MTSPVAVLLFLAGAALPACNGPAGQPPATAPVRPSTVPLEYIAISHHGLVDHPIPTLIISPLGPHVIFPECADPGEIEYFTQKPWTARQRESYQQVRCRVGLTDRATYQAAVAFVQQNPGHFTTDPQYTLLMEYTLTVRGRTYGVLLTNDQFSALLAAHLQARQGDKAVISMIRREML